MTNERTPVPLESDQRKVLFRIVSRFLNLRAGTPFTELRKQLGPRRGILDAMVNAHSLRVVSGLYLPTFRGIEQLEANDIRSLARANINCALKALHRLYDKSSDQYTFSFDAVLQEVRIEDPTRDDKDLLPALILGEEFNYYSFSNGISTRGDDSVAVQSVTVYEKILDFIAIENDWQDILTEEEANRARMKALAQTPRSSAVLPAFEASTVSLEFMLNSNLKKIVERDYAELQRVKTVAADKSRYVLCGGLIEGLLLDALLRNETTAKAAKKAPRMKGGAAVKPPADWNLGELIDVALELNIIGTDAQQFSHGVRNYRNLIHPGREMQSPQKVAPQEADIAERVLDIVIRELQQRFKP